MELFVTDETFEIIALQRKVLKCKKERAREVRYYWPAGIISYEYRKISVSKKKYCENMSFERISGEILPNLVMTPKNEFLKCK